jgi:transcriptional regulator with XRE-family HTH domain
MGKGKRARPKHLGKKLREIRTRLDLSQNAMLRHLGLESEFTRAELSAYERGVREPPLRVLLCYSNTAHLWLNVLVDDALELPAKLSARGMHPGRRTRSDKRQLS